VRELGGKLEPMSSEGGALDEGMEKDHFEYSWQQTLLDAFLASPAELAGKINIAERAIMTRLKGPEKISTAEHLAMEDALRSLKVLIADLKSQGNAQSDGDEGKKRFG
jgi:hypothetical protein